MPRRKSPPKRTVAPDNKYQNINISMLITRMMIGGKRSLAERLMYNALDIIEERAKRNPVEVLEQGLRNVTPAIEVKPMRVGGATYQVPVEVPHDRGTTLAMRWLLENARKRGGRNMSEKLANEFMDAANGQGASVKKKDDTHRMAEANRAFAHFR
ncbi:30S ribosomal protein S7 [Anaerolineae bacterium CFX9]|jgi:small subunit ribosomal protein S7|nr:30S ribosomal protein S7 [Anaerolineae bacterium CFX9]